MHNAYRQQFYSEERSLLQTFVWELITSVVCNLSPVFWLIFNPTARIPGLILQGTEYAQLLADLY